jgi:hypothetical protein
MRLASNCALRFSALSIFELTSVGLTRGVILMRLVTPTTPLHAAPATRLNYLLQYPFISTGEVG